MKPLMLAVMTAVVLFAEIEGLHEDLPEALIGDDLLPNLFSDRLIVLALTDFSCVHRDISQQAFGKLVVSGLMYAAGEHAHDALWCRFGA